MLLLAFSATAVQAGKASRSAAADQARQATRVAVSGVVTDTDGQPLPGVSVIVKGTKRGVSTDLDGKYRIEVSRGEVLQFSMIGMATEEVTYNGQKKLDMELGADQNRLSEAVVTGYSTIDRRLLTSTVTTVRSDELERIGSLSVDQMLEGKVTGLQITTSSMTPGAAAKVRVRGSGSFVGSREPLWVIDGIPYENPVELDASEINSLDNINLIGNAITGLNPNDIETINVLKDASATAIYGSRAANGVIVITTKRGKEGAKPVVTYQGTATVVTAPKYSDFDTMNSLERVDVSREMHERSLAFWSNGAMQPVGYEGALETYWKDGNFQAFQDKVSAMETLNYDWIKEYYKPVVQQSHSVSVSGGSKTARYYASLAYDSQPGNEIGTSLNRITSRANVDVNVRPNILLSFNMEGYVQNAEYNLYSDGTTSFNQAYYSNRAISPYTENGDLFFYQKKIGYQDYVAEISLNDYVNTSYGTYHASTRDDIYGNYCALNERNVNDYTVQNKGYSFQTTFQWDITKDLRWTTRLAYRNTTTNETKTYGPTSWAVTVLRGDDIEDIGDRSEGYIAAYNVIPSGGLYRGSYNESTSKLIRNQLNYTHSWGKHMINANFTQEASSVLYYGANNWDAGGYNKDQGHYFNKLSAGSPSYSTSASNLYWIYNPAGYKALAGKASGYDVYPTITDRTTNTMSWIGIFTYSYADKYILNFNARNDGSNAFGQYEKNKFRPSWSVSGRWNIHDEDWMLNKTWVNELAVRASYGFRGTRPSASPYMVLTDYYQDSDYLPFFMSELSSLGNANLKWEKSATFDFGLTGSFFNNRLSGEFDFAYTNATDLLLTRPVSLVTGAATQLYNGGEKDDFCYEFSFRAIPVKTKDFTWAINGNISYINETVIKGADDSVITIDKYLNGTMITSGGPVDGFFSYKFTGLNSEGLPTFDGFKGDYTTEYQKLLNGLVYSGSRLPLVYGGLSTDLRYKRLTLNINATYKMDYAVRLLALYSGGTSMPRSYENLSDVFNNRWRKPGDEDITNIPRLNATTTSISAVGITESSVTTGHTTVESMYDVSDARVAKGDHIRLKSITLSYQVPEFWGIKGMTLRAQAQNLAVFCFDKNLRGMDPDQVRNVGIPALPYYTFAINFSL